MGDHEQAKTENRRMTTENRRMTNSAMRDAAIFAEKNRIFFQTEAQMPSHPKPVGSVGVDDVLEFQAACSLDRLSTIMELGNKTFDHNSCLEWV